MIVTKFGGNRAVDVGVINKKRVILLLPEKTKPTRHDSVTSVTQTLPMFFMSTVVDDADFRPFKSYEVEHLTYLLILNP